MAFALPSGPVMAQQLTDEEQLGKFIFFDNNRVLPASLHEIILVIC
jgi:hypothetical protein